jgi:hypothetical protein
MIGGKVIEARRETQPETNRPVIRLWCVDHSNGAVGDELAIWIEPVDDYPQFGDDVWWQDKTAYWTPADRRFEDRKLVKVAYSFDPLSLSSEPRR